MYYKKNNKIAEETFSFYKVLFSFGFVFSSLNCLNLNKSIFCIKTIAAEGVLLKEFLQNINFY